MSKVLDESTISLFNDGRNYIASIKKFRFAIYIPIFILMLVSSLILFRSWTKRIRLMSAYLIIGSFIILAALNIGYHIVAKSLIEEASIENMADSNDQASSGSNNKKNFKIICKLKVT